MAIRVNNLTPAQLNALLAQIKRRQAAISQDRVQKVRRKIEALLKAEKLTRDDVFGPAAPAKAAPAKKPAKRGKRKNAKPGRPAKAAGATRAAAGKRAANAAQGAAKSAAKVKAGKKARKSRKGIKLGKVAPKYRNPANPQQTWAGRGHKPRWFADALAAGRKEKDMLI